MSWIFENPASVAVLLIVINIVSCLSMCLDKYYAKTGRRRISERDLFLISLPFAAFGSIVGMRLFHHKTRHAKFVWGMPCLLILQVALCCIAFWLWF